MGTARKTVLVTGFGAFPGVARNPSAALIERLAARPALLAPDVAHVFHMLPVTWAMLDTELPAIYAAHRPDAVVHFGVASRRRMVCIETRARNAVSRTSPDANGHLFGRATLAYNGPEARAATLPVRDLVSAATATGIPVRASRDAGDYLCNATLWTSLARGLAAVFVHLPQTAGENERANDRPDFDGLERAARALLATVAGHLTSGAAR